MSEQTFLSVFFGVGVVAAFVYALLVSSARPRWFWLALAVSVFVFNGVWARCGVVDGVAAWSLATLMLMVMGRVWRRPRASNA
jgi:hypothetical protein